MQTMAMTARVLRMLWRYREAAVFGAAATSFTIAVLLGDPVIPMPAGASTLPPITTLPPVSTLPPPPTGPPPSTLPSSTGPPGPQGPPGAPGPPGSAGPPGSVAFLPPPPTGQSPATITTTTVAVTSTTRCRVPQSTGHPSSTLHPQCLPHGDAS